MPIIFACPCRCVMIAPDAAADHRARCPRCGVSVHVPATSDPHATARLAADETVRVPAKLDPPDGSAGH